MKDIYDYPNQAEIDSIISNLQWVKQEKQKHDDIADDGQTQFIESCYSGIQSWGCTDYVDHRKDSLIKLKKLIEPNFNGKHGISQRGHFYDSEGNPVRVIMVRGYEGGYTGRFVYPSGTTAFNRRANKPINQ